MYAKLMWEEKDFLTRLLGFEYSDMIYGDTIYDLEMCIRDRRYTVSNPYRNHRYKVGINNQRNGE